MGKESLIKGALNIFWTRVDKELDRGKLHPPMLPGDVGWDIEASEQIKIQPGQAIDVPTNIAIQLPPGYWGEIRARSSIARRGLQVDAGTIDNGYRGPLFALVRNMAFPDMAGYVDNEAQWYDWRMANSVVIEPGERVAQLVLHRIHAAEPFYVPELDDSVRGTDGFGSTGR